MTTLNTIIEEENTPDTEWEKKATDAIIATYPEDIWPEPEYKPHDAEVSWVMRQMSKAIASILKPVVEDLLTSRDTYWKERVRKFQRRMYQSQIKLDGGGLELFEEAVGKKDIYTAMSIWQNTITDAYNQALADISANLDITNEDNLK